MATPLKATGVAIVVISATVTSVASLHTAPSITLVPVLAGLASPVFVINARDGSNRLFVVEQAGVTGDHSIRSGDQPGVRAVVREAGVLRGATGAAVCTTPNAGC